MNFQFSLKNLVPIGLIIIALIIILSNSLYLVHEGENAIVTRFSAFNRVSTSKGLHIKVPFVEHTMFLPDKLMVWDGQPKSIPTKEKQYVWVDTTARWRIVDYKLFFTRVNTVPRALLRIGEIVENSTRNVITLYPLIETVRTTNNNVAVAASSSRSGDLGSPITVGASPQTTWVAVKKGRLELAQNILTASQPFLKTIGIELVDFRFRQIRYSQTITQSVYQRMIKERNKEAQKFRSMGQGQKAQILGELNQKKQEISSKAFAEASTIKAQGDAKAAKIYAAAYNKDPEFYKLWRSLNSYNAVIKGQKPILSTDMSYFNSLYTGR